MVSDYTDLAMSTVTQTQAIPYTGPFNLLYYQLQKLTGAYVEGHGHDLYWSAFKTTSSLQRSSDWRFLPILQHSLDYAASARSSSWVWHSFWGGFYCNPITKWWAYSNTEHRLISVSVSPQSECSGHSDGNFINWSFISSPKWNG